MFKLMALLCGGLFAAMLVGGRDHGQQRFGLTPQPAAPTVVQAAVTVEPKIAPTAFVPPEPVMLPAVDVINASTATPEPTETPAATGRVLQVNSRSANVREGPGMDFAVVSRLDRGESVLVVTEGEGPDGWSLIRIEGDGVEGYVASRLLSE